MREIEKQKANIRKRKIILKTEEQNTKIKRKKKITKREPEKER